MNYIWFYYLRHKSLYLNIYNCTITTFVRISKTLTSTLLQSYIYIRCLTDYDNGQWHIISRTCTMLQLQNHIQIEIMHYIAAAALKFCVHIQKPQHKRKRQNYCLNFFVIVCGTYTRRSNVSIGSDVADKYTTNLFTLDEPAIEMAIEHSVHFSHKHVHRTYAAQPNPM